GIASKAYCPEALVCMTRLSPVDSCRTVTSAPGTSAPEVSFTTPRMRDVMVWAESESTARTNSTRIRRIRYPPKFSVWSIIPDWGQVDGAALAGDGSASRLVAKVDFWLLAHEFVFDHAQFSDALSARSTTITSIGLFRASSFRP